MPSAWADVLLMVFYAPGLVSSVSPEDAELFNPEVLRVNKLTWRYSGTMGLYSVAPQSFQVYPKLCWEGHAVTELAHTPTLVWSSQAGLYAFLYFLVLGFSTIHDGAHESLLAMLKGLNQHRLHLNYPYFFLAPFHFLMGCFLSVSSSAAFFNTLSNRFDPGAFCTTISAMISSHRS